ncbi:MULTISPECIES: outer membrane protein transport protein [Vibrio]|jgi:long-chain fatty acid transport protein|uniref:outer membrane protein transport protein n=1 Tax=Vibrio TaxID=662 RepID=UPI001F40D731|nr:MULTISPECIES: outer membrane protein transport protein [Vibrio]MCF4175623.1 OmpP1/FadL family transporter [Vibrio sp. McD22-P3]MCY9872035.1 outer membrane protein transport protein [Vibrio barjaei]
MTTSRLYKKTLLAVAVSSLTFASQHAAAAGFQLNSQSATGLGRAFAGDAVIADNASVMARNAAAMTLFDSHQFSGGVNYIKTSIDVKDVNYFTGAPVQDANNSSGTPVPNIYYIHRLNDKWALGAGIYSNFGTNNNFDDSWGGNSGDLSQGVPNASIFGGTTEISSINYTLNAAYRINEQWSVGGGIDIVQGSGKLIRSAAPGVKALDIEADGVGVGFNLGTVFEYNENNRFGFAYHYSPEIKASGDMYYNPTLTPGANLIDGQKLKLSLPSMAEFSGYHRIEDTKFAVHYSLQWIGWSVFDTLETDGGVPIKNYEWKDGYHAAIGGTYYLNDEWTLRAGYMYDTAAQDQLTSISVPDSDRQWLSAGFGYNFKKHHTVDFGLTYLMGKDVKVEETLDPTKGTMLTATTHANAWLAGIQYSYSF